MCACRSRDAAGCAERFVMRLPGIYGVVRRGSWRHTFTAPEQFTREIVSNALAAYLDETQDAWQSALEEQELREAIEAEQAERERAERQRLEQEAAERERTLRDRTESPGADIPPAVVAGLLSAAKPPPASAAPIPAAEPTTIAAVPVAAPDPPSVSEASIPAAAEPATPLLSAAHIGPALPVLLAGPPGSSVDEATSPGQPVVSLPSTGEADLTASVGSPPEPSIAEEIDHPGSTSVQNSGRDAQATQTDEPHGGQTTP